MTTEEHHGTRNRTLKKLALRPDAVPTLYLGNYPGEIPLQTAGPSSVDVDNSPTDVIKEPDSVMFVDDPISLVETVAINYEVPKVTSPPLALETLEIDYTFSASTSSLPHIDSPDFDLKQFEHSIVQLNDQIVVLERLCLDVLKEPIKQLKQQLKTFEKIRNAALLQLGSLKTDQKTLQEKCSSISSNLKKFEKIFSKEQIDMVIGRIDHPRQWSDLAIETAIEIRFRCGAGAYEYLRKRGYPFPCSKTLIQRLSMIHLAPGISKSNIKLLAIWLESQKKEDGTLFEACLSYDEMKGQPKLEYNPKIQQIQGYVTIPPNPRKDKKSKQKPADDCDG